MFATLRSVSRMKRALRKSTLKCQERKALIHLFTPDQPTAQKVITVLVLRENGYFY